MKDNQVIGTMLEHRSIRKYSRRKPSDAVVKKIFRAGQQAPFAAQNYSVLLSRNRARNPFNAPLLFTVCVDSHKFELIMAARKWEIATNDLKLLLFGLQDAAYMAENMVVAAESLGLGSCFLGMAMLQADRIAKEYDLPERVFPFVQLVMGYPAENPAPRPRYPLEFSLFEDKYPALTPGMVAKAMKVMDDGYLAQDYYLKLKGKIPLTGGRRETFNYGNYSWTEHICRKWGQWFPDPKVLLKQLEGRGFHITEARRKKR